VHQRNNFFQIVAKKIYHLGLKISKIFYGLISYLKMLFTCQNHHLAKALFVFLLATTY